MTLVALGLGNLFGLLLVVAHAVTLAWLRREYRVDRAFVLGWAAAVAATLIVVSPVAVVGYSQLHQIHWIKPPGFYALLSVERLVGDTLLFLLVLAIVAIAVLVSAGVGQQPARPAPPGGRPAWPAGLVRLALPWLLLPPAILLTASVAHPVYTFRYIVYCIPAAALLIGAALAALGRYAGPVALVVIVLAGLHSQLAERRPDGHDVNIRYADHLVARHERPGRCAAEHQRPDRAEERHRGTHPGGGLSLWAGPAAGCQRRRLTGAVRHPRRHLCARRGDPAAAHPRHQALGGGMDQAQARPDAGGAGFPADSQLGRQGPVASPLHHPGQALEHPTPAREHPPQHRIRILNARWARP